MTYSMDGSIAELLWRATLEAPDSPALIDEQGTHSYSSLRDRASAFAAALVERGVQPGDRVGVLLERGVTAVAAAFGAYAAGAAVVHINDRLQPRQIEYMLRHCGARVLISSANARLQHARPLQSDAVMMDADAPEPTAGFDPVPRAASDCAQIIYTSGSSGLPKGVTFAHGALRAGVDTCSRYLGLRASDRVAGLLPFSSVYGLNQMLTTVAVGATLVIERSPIWHDVARRLQERGVTVLSGVPPFWLMMLATPTFVDTPAPSLRILQNAGGHLPVHAVRRLRALLPNAQLFLQYGQTETFRSTFLDPAEVDSYPDSIGRAVPGAEIAVLRPDGEACAPGEIGELVFQGPSAATGYWNDPARTTAVFRPHPHRRSSAPRRVVYSGDLVRLDLCGRAYFVSRAERVIKTLGFKVGPDEVVDVLLASGEVAEAAVTGAADASRGERIIAHVVLAEGSSVASLLRYCRSEMPSYMVPARVEVYDELPRLPGGKYDLAALRA